MPIWNQDRLMPNYKLHLLWLMHISARNGEMSIHGLLLTLQVLNFFLLLESLPGLPPKLLLVCRIKECLYVFSKKNIERKFSKEYKGGPWWLPSVWTTVHTVCPIPNTNLQNSNSALKEGAHQQALFILF